MGRGRRVRAEPQLHAVWLPRRVRALHRAARGHASAGRRGLATPCRGPSRRRRRRNGGASWRFEGQAGRRGPGFREGLGDIRGHGGWGARGARRAASGGPQVALHSAFLWGLVSCACCECRDALWCKADIGKASGLGCHMTEHMRLPCRGRSAPRRTVPQHLEQRACQRWSTDSMRPHGWVCAWTFSICVPCISPVFSAGLQKCVCVAAGRA